MKKTIFTLMLLSISLVNAQTTTTNTKKDSRFSLVPSIGYAWRTAEVAPNLPADLKLIAEQVMSGFNFEVNALYRVNKNSEVSHLGLKYNRFSASASGMVFNGTSNVSVNSEDVISYFGPVYAYTSVDNTGELYFDVSLGYISYQNVSRSVGYAKVEGSNFGASLSIGYLFNVTPNFSIGPNLGLTGGTLTEYTISDGTQSQLIELDEDEKEGLGRISFTLQARIKL